MADEKYSEVVLVVELLRRAESLLSPNPSPNKQLLRQRDQADPAQTKAGRLNARILFLASAYTIRTCHGFLNTLSAENNTTCSFFVDIIL